MRIVDLGQTGEPFSESALSWDALGLPAKWRTVIEEIAPCSQPHDIQIKAIRDCKLLHSRRNLVVSGPTNSGKSLVGYLAIFAGLAEGRRTLLIEPFRALAQEKFDELSALLPRLKDVLSTVPRVEITTGDYRLNGETLMADPPASGEIVIATPERIDAIMRNPDFDPWVSSFGVVCVDEAHLIGDDKRGPVLECVITRFLCEKAPPRFVLLSATLGNCDALQSWLKPCDVVHSSIRRPPLQQEVLTLEDGEKADDMVMTSLEQVMIEPGTSALVFVYRTDDAARLSSLISTRLGPKFGDMPAAAYHSKMPAAAKTSVKAAYMKGQTRCLVSTTALGAGVNLPATHVIVRDLTFGRDGLLPVRELLQMMGRAGRGERSGTATAILKPTDDWAEGDLAEQIKHPSLPELKSVLARDAKQGVKPRLGGEQDSQVAKLILGQLARRDNQSLVDLRAFFDCSLGGKEIKDQVDSAVRWLYDGQRNMAWQGEQGVVATALGKAVARTGIPLEVGAGFGALIRDVLMCDPDDRLLKSWTLLDTLMVMELLNPRERGLKRFSKDLAEQVEDWIEREAMKSVLFAEWIRGATGASKAEEVLGSLGITLDVKKGMAEAARQYAYVATMRAIVIYQLGNGLRTEDVGRRWNIKGLDGVQERWRDHLLWQLSGIAEIFDIRCFYNCLRKECDADEVRVARVKNCFKGMIRGVYDLMGLLRFCSPLGPLFRDLEAAKVGVGVRTKDKLENAGVSSFAEISKMTADDFRRTGIRKDLARKLKEYVRRRTL
jgi:replicative superfamily II helicase